MKVVESIEIEGAPEDVWAVISDPDTHVRWRPALREFRPVSDGPLAVGSHVREVLVWRGREIVLDDIVTALDAPRRLGLVAAGRRPTSSSSSTSSPSPGGRG